MWPPEHEFRAPLLLLMGEWLKMRNFQVVEAKDGWEAVAVELRERANLIPWIWISPVLDGAEVTCLLREHEELHDVPVVAITAHDTADARAGASDVGCHAFITMPIDSDRLEQITNRHFYG